MMLEEVSGVALCDREGSKKTVVLIDEVCPRSVASKVGVGDVNA